MICREIGAAELLQPVGESQIPKMHQSGAEFEQLKERSMELLQKELRETKRQMRSNK